MGNGRFNAADWQSYAATNVTGKSQAQVFTSRSVDAQFDPRKIAVRESRDSVQNPNSTPIVLASDVTGSMGMVAHELMKTGLNTLASEIYDRKPVPDPHVMVMAVGDGYSDIGPLQCTEFEADISLADQVRRLWLEGNGGGNNGESYSLAHWFAGMKTSTDAQERHGRKGYLFTIGDEPIHDGITVEQAERILGVRFERDMTAKECLALAQRQYEVFHVVIKEGYANHGMDEVLRTWKPLLPERLLILDDHRKLAEVVVSAIQVHQGASRVDVAASWSGDTALVVANAIKGLDVRRGAARGIRTLD